MTMENDLVERLDKAVERCKAILKHDLHDGLDTDFALMAQYRLSEAASRIQALEAELAMAHKERDAALDHDWVAAPAYAAKVTMCREFRDRAERAEAELARKTEALEGLSQHADWHEKVHGADADEGLPVLVRLKYLRAARSALEEKTDV